MYKAPKFASIFKLYQAQSTSQYYIKRISSTSHNPRNNDGENFENILNAKKNL